MQVLKYHQGNYVYGASDLSNIREITNFYSGQLLSKMCQNVSNSLTDSTINEMPSGKYLWCTINWDNTKLDLPDIKQQLESIVKHKYIKYFWYNYEQRGKSRVNCGTGVHNHLLFMLDGDFSLSTIKRMIIRKIKSFIGNARHVDLRKTDFPSDKLEYLQGNKKSPSKDKMIEQDDVYRQVHKLKVFYTNYLIPPV